MSNPPPAPQQQRNIQAIPTASVAKICSGQVILDLSMAVKELLENALDAGATSVEIRLRQHGLALIEVADNGKGVPPEDHAALALKYHTSKINQFQDLEALHTFGFRGEALSSLAALGQLSVITRTAQQAAATRLEYDSNGVLTSSTPVARAVGTTVALRDLFEPLPVRRQEFTRNVRREVAKLKLLLQQYAILSTQAQLFASDQSGKSARSVLVSTGNAGATLLERVSAVLGSKASSVLVPLEVKLQEEGVTITGLVSRAGCGVKGDKLRQFCCINGRPVELPRAIKTLNDTYKSLYSSLVGLRPMAFLCFELPPGSFDVNVTPDKRSVFVQREVALVSTLQQALQALWEPSRYSYAVNTTQAAFDLQRQPQPLTPAAAAAAGGGEQLDGPGAGQQQQQHDAVAEEAAAAEAEGSEEEVQDEGAAAAGSSSRAVVGDPRGGPPSLASFMIAGGPAGAGGGGGGGAAAGQKRLRPLEAALLGRKVPRQQLGSGSVSGGPSATAAAAAAAADSSLDVSAAAAAAGSDVDEEGESEEEEEEEEEAAAADTAAAAAAAAAAGPGTGLRRQQPQQGVPLPLASFQLGGSSSQQPVATQTAGAALAATHLEEQSRSAAAATGGRRSGGAAAAAGQASLAAFGFKVLQGGCHQQQQQQRGGAASTQEESGDESDGQEAAEQQQLSAPVGGAGAGAVEVVDMSGSEEQGGLVEEGTETEEGDLQQQQQAGGSGEEGEGEEVMVVGEQQRQGRAGGDRHQQRRQQRQQQRQRSLVVDYSMQQLVADVEAQLQQLRVQQQQEQGLQGEGHTGQHPGLAAASLQGQDASGSQDAPAAAEADGTAAAAAAGSTDAATDELMRVFSKADFAAMSAVGQFNLGFIIARLRGDLFIVDQHAADEKSTFERLMGSFAVNRQPLLQPRRLATLTPMDQQTIRENIDIFRRNGFDFVDRDVQPAGGGQQGTHRQQQQQGASSDQQHQQRLWSKPPRSKAAAAAAAAGDAAAAATGRDGCGGDSQQQQQQQQQQQEEEQAFGFGVDVDAEGCGRSELLLSMVPVLKSGASGGGALGEEVLLELLDLIAAGETRPEDIRPKKVRDVLASRACRTSVMIGSPLSRQQQGRILARLAQLDAPFNCPHGRPTMRHLAVLPADEGPPARQQPAAEAAAAAAAAAVV